MNVRVAVVGAVLALAHVGHAGTGPASLDLPDTPTDLVVTPGWAVAPTATSSPEVLAALAGPGGLHATVVRLATPNPRAWRADKREPYLAEVVEGFAALASGRVVSTRSAAPVPTLDLDFVRASSREVVRARVQLFRTYTLVLVIAGSSAAARAHRAAIAALRDGFALPAGWQPPS